MSLGVVVLGVTGLVGLGTANAGATPSATPAASAPADGHAGVAAAKARITKVVVFQDAKFKNRSTTFTKNVPHLKKFGWDNTISSAKNKGNRTVSFHQHPDYKGAKFALAPGHTEAHFSKRGMHDNTSSIKFH
ncbi:beta/gamma crystallin-related protein [Streptomyces roseolilacinus]|uniref:Beta/gamma crystallin 'Greek key' domain-containing protein n=1 Tax=Streptomyces roseolilacinus TaxID=66904 RepID=A0A918B5J6_9ACTN|nr:beta/gamma crystallin-related protein [Streptomyces roseolilacinus]GGQ21712.1 hypothetical protein GCM10010249_45600 [Streptomyces roseolilacinus]